MPKEETYIIDLLLLGGNGLGEGKERKGKVDETVLVLLELLVLDELQQLKAHETSDEGCGGNHGRDNLSSNTLRLNESVNFT